MKKKRIPRLTHRDWVELFYALESKILRLRDGHYGRDAEARRWRRHLAAIRRKIVRAGIQV
jgi:hypothetical protein